MFLQCETQQLVAVTKHSWTMRRYEKITAYPDLSGHDKEQRRLVSEVRWVSVSGTVCDVQCQGPLRLAAALHASELEAEQEQRD